MRLFGSPSSFRGAREREPGIHWAARIAVGWIPGSRRFASRPGMTPVVRCEFAFPRHECARVLAMTCPSMNQRAQGMPGARCTRGLIRKGRRARMSIQAQRRHPDIPCAMVYGLFRALPGDRACLPPSPAGTPRKLDASVGRQDHTALPSAPVPFVFRYRLRPSHPAPTFRDDHDTPL